MKKGFLQIHRSWELFVGSGTILIQFVGIVFLLRQSVPMELPRSRLSLANIAVISRRIISSHLVIIGKVGVYWLLHRIRIAAAAVVSLPNTTQTSCGKGAHDRADAKKSFISASFGGCNDPRA